MNFIYFFYGGGFPDFGHILGGQKSRYTKKHFFFGVFRGQKSFIDRKKIPQLSRVCLRTPQKSGKMALWSPFFAHL